MNLGSPRILDPVTRDAVLAALRSGELIKAIKYYRLATGASLAEAKGAVETMAAQNGIPLRVPAAAMRFPFTSVMLVCVLIAVAIAIASRGH